MNEEYSAGSVGGKFRLLRWIPDARYPFQRTCEFQTKTDFCSSAVNPKIEVPKFDNTGIQVGLSRRDAAFGGSRKTTAASLTALTSVPARARQRSSNVEHTTAAPSKSSTCFPVSHANRAMLGRSGCALFLTHMHDNICDGDKALYNYVVDWMASGVQHPENPDRSALSLRGDPGSGKGVFTIGYGSLFGRHFLHATQREHVTGKFNSHQAECCLIFVDEALYAQIKSDAQILKTLTTETTKILERKGIDAVQVDNYARLIFATNDDHPIMIEHNDRRYCAIYIRFHPSWAGKFDKEAAPIRKAYFQASR